MNNSYEIFENSLKSCLEIFNEAKNIVITTHLNPDGDAIGSVLALYYYARQRRKYASIISYHDLPKNYRFLDVAENIKKYDQALHNELIEKSDTIFILDLNDITRVKTLQEPIQKANAKIVVIDHHLEPKEFADLYLIDSDATSTGEILFKLLKQDDNFILTKDIATALYTAIMTDSGSFRFPRTDGNTHRIIAELIDAGADPVKIYDEVYNQVPARTTRLLGITFSGIEIYHDGKLLIATITKDDFAKTGAIEEDVENFAETLLSVKGVYIGILLTELPGKNEIRISLRSKGEYSVRDIALKHNGGGHFYAAGARVYDTKLQEIKSKLIDEFGEIINARA